MKQRLPARLVNLLLACSLSFSLSVSAEEDPAMRSLIDIDGFSVTTLHLALFASQTGRNPEQAEAQIRMLNELANNFMVANSAEGKALEAQPEITAALEVARARLVAQAFVRSELEKAQIDEDAVRKRYDETHGNTTKEEFKARHILLNSKDAALATIKALDGGKDFAELAKEHSVGPSKTVGGDLGWFEADQMVPAFSEATQALANGSYSKEPVKTQFGWHVILREDSRSIAPPDFETARPEIENAIRQEHVAELITRIRNNAKIEVQRLEEETQN